MATSKAAKANKIKPSRKKRWRKKNSKENKNLVPKTTSTNTVTQPAPKTMIKTAIANLERDESFSYCGVEYECDSHYSCHGRSDYYSDGDSDDYYSANSGRCDGICRCGQIENARVTEVDINYLTKYLCGLTDRDIKDNNELIDQYCVDRVLRINSLYMSGSWEITVCGGYYGDEIESTRMEDSTRKSIITALHGIAHFRTNSEKIKKVLEYEYGFVLPQLIPLSEAYIETVDINDLMFGNKEYAKKIKKPDIELYDSYDLPRAICTTEAGVKPGQSKYRVIDGYHRVLSAKNRGDKEIKIIILDY